MIRRLALLMPSVVAAVAALFVGGSPAHAAGGFPYGLTTLTDSATGLCLIQTSPVTGTSPASLATTGSANCGQPTAYWSLVAVDHFGNYEILNGTDANTCLDSNASGHAYVSYCNSGGYQKWTVTPNDASGSSPSEIRDTATNLCLDSNPSGQVYTLACNSGGYQRWQRPFTSNNITDNATGLCVGIDFSSGLAGDWTCTSNPDQMWHWGAQNQQGYSQLINGNGVCLGVQNGSAGQGADIQARACDGGPDEYWTRLDGPQAEQTRLVNFHSHLVMGVLGGSTANGTALVQWSIAGADQYWKIGKSTFDIENANASGKCVGADAISGLAGLWNCTTHPDQVWGWLFTNANGYGMLQNRYAQCLGLLPGTSGAGAQLYATTCSRSDGSQYWKLTSTTAPSFLQNASSGLVLAVSGGSTANGAPLVEEPSGTPDEIWSGP